MDTLALIHIISWLINFVNSVAVEYQNLTPWVEAVVEISVMAYVNEIQVFLVGHNLQPNYYYWLCFSDLNSIDEDDIITPFSDVITLKLDDNAIGSLFYRIKVTSSSDQFQQPPSDAWNDAPSSEFYREMVWDAETLTIARSTTPTSLFDDVRSGSRVGSCYNENEDKYPQGSVDNINISVRQPSVCDWNYVDGTSSEEEEEGALNCNTTIVDNQITTEDLKSNEGKYFSDRNVSNTHTNRDSPLVIRVVHVAGGGFDGAKQIMVQQWRSMGNTG